MYYVSLPGSADHTGYKQSPREVARPVNLFSGVYFQGKENKVQCPVFFLAF